MVSARMPLVPARTLFSFIWTWVLRAWSSHWLSLVSKIYVISIGLYVCYVPVLNDVNLVHPGVCLCDKNNMWCDVMPCHVVSCHFMPCHIIQMYVFRYTESTCTSGYYQECKKTALWQTGHQAACLLTCLCITKCDYLYLKFEPKPHDHMTGIQLCEVTLTNYGPVEPGLMK